MDVGSYADLFPDIISDLEKIRDVCNNCLNAVNSDSAYNSVRVIKILKSFDKDLSEVFTRYRNDLDNIFNEFYLSNVDD